MSATQKARAENLATPATYLKQQQELSETPNQRIGKLLDNVATYERIIGIVRQWRKYEQDEELVQKMEDAIQKANHQIAEIMEKQRAQSEEHLAVDETVSRSEVPTISEKQAVSPQTGGMFGKGNKREEAHQLSHNRSQTSHDADKTPQTDEEQAGRQFEEMNIVPIPHKRVDALRSLASRPAKPSASQGRLQQEAWSLGEFPGQLGPQGYKNAWMSTAVIQELLRENLEKQRVLIADLKRSEEEIRKMQKEIERDGGLEEEVLQQMNVDVETFLRDREEIYWWGDEEGDE